MFEARLILYPGFSYACSKVRPIFTDHKPSTGTNFITVQTVARNTVQKKCTEVHSFHFDKLYEQTLCICVDTKLSQQTTFFSFTLPVTLDACTTTLILNCTKDLLAFFKCSTDYSQKGAVHIKYHIHHSTSIF